MYFITIITPTYNREKLIGLAIESIINQKKDIPFDWEMLIIDDGSIDNTKKIVEKYRKKYPKNIFYFYQKNSGIPGVARNVCLDNMNKKSDYVIFLDSDDELVDDCINTCLKKWEELKRKGKYEKYLGLTYYCKTQYGKLIGNKKILQGKRDVDITYQKYLAGQIYWETHSILKSYIFIDNQYFRFEKDIVNESVLRSKIQKYYYNELKMSLLIDYIGRIYRIEKGSDQITKSINMEKFKKNAIGNQKILSILGDDMLKFGYRKIYSEYLFKIAVNRIIYGKKQKGVKYIKSSLKTHFNFRNFIIFLLSKISRKFIIYLYKIYIR